MARALMVVLTDPKNPELEDAFNEWYTNVHIPEVLETPGFAAVTRYKASEAEFVPRTPGQKYLAIWEIEADDISAAAKALQDQAVKAGWALGDAIDPASISIRFFEPLTQRITKDQFAK